MYSSKNFKVASLSLSKIISSNSKIFFGSRMTFSSYTYTTSLKYIFIFTPILNGIKLYYVNLISIQKLMGHKGLSSQIYMYVAGKELLKSVKALLTILFI